MKKLSTIIVIYHDLRKLPLRQFFWDQIKNVSYARKRVLRHERLNRVLLYFKIDNSLTRLRPSLDVTALPMKHGRRDNTMKSARIHTALWSFVRP